MNDMCKPTDVGGVLTWEHMADTWRNVLPSCPPEPVFIRVCSSVYVCARANDYRGGRKETGITALDPRAQDFDLMYEQVRHGVALSRHHHH